MGHIQPQKKRPRTKARPIKTRAGHISKMSFLVAKKVLAARKGSILKRRFTA